MDCVVILTCKSNHLFIMLWQALLAKGQLPTQQTAGAFLDALKLNRQTDRCVAVFSEMIAGGADVGNVCFNIVVSALVQVWVACEVITSLVMTKIHMRNTGKLFALCVISRPLSVRVPTYVWDLSRRDMRASSRPSNRSSTFILSDYSRQALTNVF